MNAKYSVRTVFYASAPDPGERVRVRGVCVSGGGGIHENCQYLSFGFKPKSQNQNKIISK